MSPQRRELILARLAAHPGYKAKEASVSLATTAMVLRKAATKARILKALKKAVMEKRLTGEFLLRWPKYHNILINALS